MNTADSKTRSKVVLEPSSQRGRAVTQALQSSALFALGLGLSKELLVVSSEDCLWRVLQILGLGATMTLMHALRSGQWRRASIDWPVVGLASLLQLIRLFSLLFALTRLSAVRVVIISNLSAVWMKSILMPSDRQSLLILGALVFSYTSDARFTVEGVWTVGPAYIALMSEALSSSVLDHTHNILLPSLGGTMTAGFSIIGGFLATAIVFLCSAPLFGTATTSGGSYASALLPVLTYSLLSASPALVQKFSATPSNRDMVFSHLAVFGIMSILSVLKLLQPIAFFDIVVGGLLCYGMATGKDRSAFRSPYTSLARLTRSYLKSILENPESRKIFYFLVLNMCYMLVQMLYGIWTNSLGLISDAIHMAFDCMAIGVGLIASVMARWAPNERFTYGYGRIETLSGFSNGIFLILISIFIVFEAIERLIDPPEMNTSQLLLVSTLGLCVNLFGMFAMGGHHHHGGHSHSHGHSHNHGYISSNTSFEADHQRSFLHDSEFPEPRIGSPSSATVPGGGCGDNSAAHMQDYHDESPNLESGPGYEALLHSHHTHKQSHPHSHSHVHPPSHSTQAGLPSHLHSHCLEPLALIRSPSPAMPGGSSVIEESSVVRGGRLEKSDAVFNLKSPLTPSYQFGHDRHFEEHHAHGHGPNVHDHTHTGDHGHEGHSHNMRGVFLHVMADTLGSVGVIVSTLLIQLYGWTGFDPIASLFIAVLIAASVVPLVMDTGKVLMLDISHKTSGIAEALSLLHHVQGLESFSMPRFWPKDDNMVIGSIHVIVSPSTYMEKGGLQTAVQGRSMAVDHVVEKVDSILHSQISGLEELTIQVEYTC